MFFKKFIRWIKIFESSEEADAMVPLNRTNTLIVKGKKICVAHTKDGYFAVNDKCPHNGASLGMGGMCTDDNAIVCPVHRYKFDLKTGRAKSGFGEYVKPYPLETREDGIYIGFEETAWSFF